MRLPALTRFALFVLAGACFNRMLHAEFDWAVGDLILLVSCLPAHDFLCRHERA